MSNPYLIQPDLSKPPTDLLKSPLPYPLDPFQQYALEAIHKQNNVFICAKTGSGKTAVAEIGIYRALDNKKRIFYTSPIKSLSNQKFSDLTKQFPHVSVGIMTGDIKFQPDAQILVMTTEILRNLLYKQGTKTQTLGLTASLSLDNLGLVIFDECHYINDPDRGKVWEETMILVPSTVQLILLSATLEKPAIFAQWLGQLKKVPIYCIETQYRIVPLTHAIINPTTDEFEVTLTPTTVVSVSSASTNKSSNSSASERILGEVFQDKIYRDYLTQLKAIKDGHAVFKEKVHNKLLSGEKGAVEGKIRPKTFVHQLNHTLQLLLSRNQLPALFFVFSRKGCESLASKVEHTFLDTNESSQVLHTMNYHLHPFKESLESLPQYHQIRDLLLKGIAYHHSGLLPLLKEIIEILFTKGLVKLLFATETFAVGLNMPTKTVVFTGLSKYDDLTKGQRLLRTDEYTQMAGRAGRRGKDKEGLVLYLPERDPVSVYELQQIMKGSKQPVLSRMDFGYDFLLKTLNAGNTSWLQLMEQSYWFQQRQAQLQQNEKEATAIQAKITTVSNCLSPELIAICEEKKARIEAIRDAKGNKFKKLQQEFNAWSAATLQTSQVQAALLNYQSLQDLQAELRSATNYNAYLKDHASGMEPTVAFLRSAGYLKESLSPLAALSSSDLTLRGTLATEINEGHPLLMTELFLSKAAHGLTGPELAALLSVFLEDFDKDAAHSLATINISKEIKDIMRLINADAKRLSDVEYELEASKSEDDWNLSLQWAELVYRWLTEEGVHIATLCQDYGTFEGNLVRGFLKLTNLLDEWSSLATFCENADQLEKITTTKALLVRGLVQPTSLYLRL
jgi:ATP-dependent RNA helicase DOB1